MKIILLFSFLINFIRAKELSPVLIIPGIGGNQLEARLENVETEHFLCSKNYDWYRIWFSMKNLLPFIFDCWISNMKPLFDPIT